MYHSRPTDLVIRCIAVGLENAFELSQEPLRPIASATQAEIEHYSVSGETVLPEIGLVIFSPALACLHIHWGLQSRPTVRTREEHAEKADQTVPIIPGTVRPCGSAFPGTSASHARIGRDSRQDR